MNTTAEKLNLIAGESSGMEANINGLSSYGDTDVVFDNFNEQYNLGTYHIMESSQRAYWYKQTYPNMFPNFDDRIQYPDASKSFGVFYNLISGPMVMDPSTAMGDEDYQTLLLMIDDSYSPIYILHEDGICQVRPEDLKAMYKDIFKNPKYMKIPFVNTSVKAVSKPFQVGPSTGPISLGPYSNGIAAHGGSKKKTRSKKN